jgi:hypothetical protein
MGMAIMDGEPGAGVDVTRSATISACPSSDKLHAPTLSQWDMQIDCLAS